MRSPIPNILSWIIRTAISLAVVVTLLLGYKFLQEEFAKIQDIESQQPKLRKTLADLEANKERFAKQITQRVPNTNSPPNLVQQQVKWLKDEIKTREQQRKLLWENDPVGRYNPVSPTFREITRLDIELTLLNEAIEYAHKVYVFVAGEAALQNRLRELAGRSAQLEKLIYDNKHAQWQLAKRHPVLWQIPGTPIYQQMKRLEDDERSLQQEKARIDNEYAHLNRPSSKKPPAPFAQNLKQSPQAIEIIRDLVAENDRVLEGSNLRKFIRPIRDALPTAAMIIGLALFSRFLVKAAAYYLIAPAACRRPAVRVLDQCAGSISTVLPKDSPEPGNTMPSRVSLPVTVAPRSELLIVPSYIHGMPASAPSSTQWLLDWSIPITSLLAGMYRLTRIRPTEETHVTVSSATDPLAEFSLIEVPVGSAVVLLPRNLVGIVQKKDSPVHITRHWRIANLKSWMTLQFRYIVFHGPALLIVKGCRGVRVEPANAGRTVNQAATLGFSANLAYSVSRNETFWSYYFGERELFNDAWSGDGYSIHSETPEATGRSKLFGRGLEGILDTALRLFGI